MNGQKLEHHPASNLFPMMDDFDLGELAADINANGLLEPITLYEGMILDGRNRHAACIQAGVELRFCEANGIRSPVFYVVSKNLHRRHLTVSQRSAIGAEVAAMLQPGALLRQKHGRHKATERAASDLGAKTLQDNSGEICGRSAKIAAAQLGVGQKSIQRAISVRKADPVVFEKVKTGEVTLSEAQRVIAGQPAKSKRQEICESADKRRFSTALSQIRGLCTGLRDINLSSLESEEKKIWRKIALEAVRDLRALASKLR